MIQEGYLNQEWELKIPPVSVFDIETLETPCDDGLEHKLVSIAMASEVDLQKNYWVIDKSTDTERQKIGIYLNLMCWHTI